MPKKLVPKVRVELTRSYPHRFLRPARLPFRHFGFALVLYDMITAYGGSPGDILILRRDAHG